MTWFHCHSVPLHWPPSQAGMVLSSSEGSPKGKTPEEFFELSIQEAVHEASIASRYTNWRSSWRG